MNVSIDQLLAVSQARHSHLCPRQVLGVRIGLAGFAALEQEPHTAGKNVLVILETDGCFADGVESATGCTVGHRTLRVEDYGKIAAVFVEVPSGKAVRVSPQINVRSKAVSYAVEAHNSYQAMLQAYRTMPEADLLDVRPVSLTTPIETLISQAGLRAVCERCGEEIINEREVALGGQVLCRACGGLPYYAYVPQSRR